MDNLDLANKEDEIYSVVLETNGSLRTIGTEKQLRQKGVYDKYKQVHSSYADKSDKDLESLKRGLFIQWYSLTEPPYLTGINELEQNAERKIIEQIDNLITSEKLDHELKWMLKYYCNWDYVFERFKEYKGLQHWIQNQMGSELPDTIDRNEMQQRGQMGRYWNSLDRFKS